MRISHRRVVLPLGSCTTLHLTLANNTMSRRSIQRSFKNLTDCLRIGAPRCIRVLQGLGVNLAGR